jgi:hypothetical protein
MFDNISLLFRSVINLLIALLVLVLLAAYVPDLVVALSGLSQATKNLLGGLLSIIPGIGVNLQAVFMATVSDNQILWLLLFIILQLLWMVAGTLLRR